ncbi:MAG: DUF962 domain-containing protein [Candidatus Obscuribacterales bacterium]|nr:DUF962 domain-containing protein [Candidatus Obscuribacterales bacterium]
MSNNGSHSSVKVRQVRKTDSNCAESKSCPFKNAQDSVSWFVKDYIGRHAHPVNASLHIVGVPAAFAGFFYLLTGRDVGKGALLVFLGYLLQYLGHQAQGNEVGEVTLIKNIYKKVKNRSKE